MATWVWIVGLVIAYWVGAARHRYRGVLDGYRQRMAEEQREQADLTIATMQAEGVPVPPRFREFLLGQYDAAREGRQ